MAGATSATNCSRCRDALAAEGSLVLPVHERAGEGHYSEEMIYTIERGPVLHTSQPLAAWSPTVGW